MKNTPEVSVIIPVYDTEKYLRQCLDSVVNQTLRDIEILCVNDGSDDGSMKILKEYAAKDERIRILSEPRSNAGAARNLGLSQARGEYLSFLDSDDFFEPAMLEHMYRCARQRNADIVICEMKMYDEDSKESEAVDWHIVKDALPSKQVFSFYDIEKNAFRVIISYVWDRLIRRDLVKDHRLKFQSQPLYNDAVFADLAMLSANNITVLDEVLVYKRKRSAHNSITDGRYEHIDCVYSVLSELKRILENKGLYARYERDFISYAVHLMNHTCPDRIPDPAAEKDTHEKISRWLEEFEITGHAPAYYFEEEKYRTLLLKVKTKTAEEEYARLEREQDGLPASGRQ